MIERKYLAHYLDASFGGEETEYVRLGADLEEYNEELNPDVEITKNIIGEQRVSHNGYEVQSEVDPYYADYDDPLFEKLSEWAYREKVYVVPSSIGGDTSGVQIPFTLYNAGERVKGEWDVTQKTFTEPSAG